MKVAIIGSRNLNVDISKFVPKETSEIISGGAKGIDTLVATYADQNSIPKRIIKPDYRKYGKAAPLKRNETIVAMADVIVAGKSHGTKYVIDYAKRVEKDVEIYIILQNKTDTLNN